MSKPHGWCRDDAWSRTTSRSAAPQPLTRADTFGDEYFALREELQAQEIPIYRPLPTL